MRSIHHPAVRSAVLAAFLLALTALAPSLVVDAAADTATDSRLEALGARAFEAGRQAVEAGDDAKALDHFERALRAAPDDLRYGSEYRLAIVRLGEYDRAIAFFEELVEQNPEAPNAHLNLGYAYVDKSPEEGAVTQVLLANTALEHFTAALEAEETWLVRYTRGNSYLYWPPIFGRTALGLDDLERAIELAKTLEPRPYHVRAWVALGDGHVRLGELDEAHDAWTRGLEQYPGDAELERRLAADDGDLDALVADAYATDRRVDTDLSPIWSVDRP